MGSGDCTISAVCWAPLVLLSLYCAREQQQCCRRAQRDITLTLAASLLVRLVWFAAFHDYADSVWQYLLNRLSIMLQCTAVLMLLFIWLNSMTQNKSKFIKYRNISIGLFAIIWLLIIISTCLGHRNYLYRSNLVAIGAVSFTIAFAALCYGLIVQRKMRNFVDDETLLSTEYPKRKRIARRLTLVSAVLSACFAFRAVCFGIAHEYSPNILFPWFYYHVPEIVPLFTILIEISAENGIFRRLFKLLTPRAQEARFSENTDYPRPTTNSITLGTVVMEMNSEESADDSDA